MTRRSLLMALCAALVAVTLGTGLARAQGAETERVAAAKEMMEAAGVARQFDMLMPPLIAQMAQGFTSLAPDKGDAIREVFEQLAVKFAARKQELIDQIAGLYAAELTLDDLKGVVAFYKSALGVKFVQVQPVVSRQALALGQRWGATIGREIEAEARAELRKRGIDL